MIVESMTHTEVYSELDKDRENVTRWWRHQLSDQRRRVLKCRQFPFHIWKDYTSTRKNRYLIFSRIFDKRMQTILTGVGVVRRMSEGMAIYTSWLSDQRLIAPMVILPHAWKRYAERAKVQKTGIDLVKHYFLNNPHGMDSNNQKAVGRSVRYNAEDHLSYCVPDGVMLGQLSDGLFVARTFITYDMCSGLQQAEFEDKRSRIVTDRELYDRARVFYY